jgi:hypothetical protein
MKSSQIYRPCNPPGPYRTPIKPPINQLALCHQEILSDSSRNLVSLNLTCTPLDSQESCSGCWEVKGSSSPHPTLHPPYRRQPNSGHSSNLPYRVLWHAGRPCSSSWAYSRSSRFPPSTLITRTQSSFHPYLTRVMPSHHTLSSQQVGKRTCHTLWKPECPISSPDQRYNNGKLSCLHDMLAPCSHTLEYVTFGLLHLSGY